MNALFEQIFFFSVWTQIVITFEDQQLLSWENDFGTFEFGLRLYLSTSKTCIDQQFVEYEWRFYWIWMVIYWIRMTAIEYIWTNYWILLHFGNHKVRLSTYHKYHFSAVVGIPLFFLKELGMGREVTAICTAVKANKSRNSTWRRKRTKSFQDRSVLK